MKNSKEGMLTELKRNEIYNMDCIIGMGLIPEGAVDLLLTDLPYGMTACYWDRLLPLEDLWKQAWRVLKPNGAAVFTACQPFTTQLIQSCRRHFRYCWYWKKNYATGFCYSKYQPMRCIEDVVVFYQKAPVYHPQGLIELSKPIRDKRKRMGNTIYRDGSLARVHEVRFANYPQNLLEFSGEHGLHPTQKPVALMEYLVRTYTDEGDLVLDCCMGSGTTAIACLRSGRDYVGFELDETYYRIACDRVRAERSCL